MVMMQNGSSLWASISLRSSITLIPQNDTCTSGAVAPTLFSFHLHDILRDGFLMKG